MAEFDLTSDDPERARAEAVAALERGELVLVPTETVYGVAGREHHPEALRRLDALKPGRTRPFSVAVHDLSMLAERLAPLSPPARRVAARWWPGPVTQVLPTVDGSGDLGVRVPGHDWTRRLLESLGAGVWLPSANPPGAEPPLEMAGVDPAVRAAVAVTVDGGRTALGDASTVWQPGSVAHRLLREGVVSAADLRRHATATVVLVCSGNTCRSPMATALLGAALDAAAERDPRLLLPALVSAGVATAPGRSASPAAVEVMDERGLDLRDHATHPLSDTDLTRADLVLCMTSSHVAAVRQRLQAAPPRSDGDLPVVELFDPTGRDVEDPFGGSVAVYETCAANLERMASARAAAFLEDLA